ARAGRAQDRQQGKRNQPTCERDHGSSGPGHPDAASGGPASRRYHGGMEPGQGATARAGKRAPKISAQNSLPIFESTDSAPPPRIMKNTKTVSHSSGNSMPGLKKPRAQWKCVTKMNWIASSAAAGRVKRPMASKRPPKNSTQPTTGATTEPGE